MISLTTAHQIRNQLGGATTVGYDKMVISPFTLNPVEQTVSATIKLSIAANPSMTPVNGRLTISIPNSLLEVEVPQVDFYFRTPLNASQRAAVLTIIQNAQNALEAGLISLGAVSGTQETGV